MYLTLTQYLDRRPHHVRDHLAESVSTALRAAADRVQAPFTPVETAVGDRDAVVDGGLDLLDGSSIHWDGDDDLTAIRVRVPWRADDPMPQRRLLAANRFVHVLTDTMRAAA